MPRGSPRIVIDAHPRGPDGPLAALRVRERSVLERLVEQTRRASAAPVLILAARDEHAELQALLPGRDADACEFTSAPAPPESFVVRTDRLYESARLRRALRAGRDPETAAIWRLDTPAGLAGAEQELERRQSYQPLGRYWALAPARALARFLAPTGVRPNALTLAAAGLMLGAAALVAFATPGTMTHGAIAVALALALVLDTADGHLARLQGTASEFGRWLDAYLDELADMSLHAAIAWGACVRDGHWGWLAAGMVYAMGKYQFVVATTEPANDGWRGEDAIDQGKRHAHQHAPAPSRLVSTVRLVGHADVRWHVWIALAAVGRLDWALVTYAVYFLARALAVAVRKGVRRD